MIVLQILIAVVAAIGLGFILSDIFRIPKYPVSKAITALGKRQKKKTNPLDIWLGDLANRIADKLKLNEYKRLQLKADLDSADMTVSPEQYVANAVVKALFIGIFAIEEAKAQLGEVSFTVPFSPSVKEQMQQGKLFDRTSDKRFESRMRDIAGQVVAYGTD